MDQKYYLVAALMILFVTAAFSQSQESGPWLTQKGADGVQIWLDLGNYQAVCERKDSISIITDPAAGVTGKGAVQFTGNSGARDRRDWWLEYAFELPEDAMALLSGEKKVWLYGRVLDAGAGGGGNSVWIDFYNDSLGINNFEWPQADSADVFYADPTTVNHRLGNENSKSPYYQPLQWVWTGYKEGISDPPWSYPCFWDELWQVPGEENVMRFRMYERESRPDAIMLDAVVITDDSTWLRTLTDEAGFLLQDPVLAAYEDAMANGTPLKNVVSGGPWYTKLDENGAGQVWIDAGAFQNICEESDSITVVTDPSSGANGKGAIQFSGMSGPRDPEDWWVEYDFVLPDEWLPLMDGSTVFYMYGRLIDIGGGTGANSVFVVVQNDSSGGKNFVYPEPDATGKLLSDPASSNSRLGNEHTKNAYFQQFQWLWSGYKEGVGEPPWSVPCFWNGLWSIPGEENVMRIRIYERESSPDAYLLDAFLMTPDSTWLRSLTDEAGFVVPSTLDSLLHVAMVEGTVLQNAPVYTSVKSRSVAKTIEGYTLRQNYPNPFNPSTSISFTIPQNEYVTISVYNLLGGLVTELYKGKLMAGEHVVAWNGTDKDGKLVPSGLYFYQLHAGKVLLTKKMALTK